MYTKKKTMYIHIGGYKTGSTSIQEFLRKNRNMLEQNNFFVPHKSLECQHLLPLSILHAFANKPTTFPPMPKSERPLEYWWDILDEQVAKSHCDNIVISSENFCDLVHPDVEKSQQNIKDFIKKRLAPYKIYILFYIRELNSYLHSWYNELVKSGVEKDDYQIFLKKYAKVNMFHIFQYKILDFYTSIFGKNALIVKKFLPNNNIITDFLSTINCAIPNKLANDIYENQKLNDDFLFYKLIFNHFDFYDRDYNKKIVNVLNRAKENNDTNIDRDVFETLINVKRIIKEKYGIEFPADGKEKMLHSNIKTNDIFLATILSAVLKENRTIRAEINTIKDMLRKLTVNKD